MLAQCIKCGLDIGL